MSNTFAGDWSSLYSRLAHASALDLLVPAETIWVDDGPYRWDAWCSHSEEAFKPAQERLPTCTVDDSWPDLGM
jgi:hypothetical protein